VYVQKKPENIFIENKPGQTVTDLLAESEKAVREGNSKAAYELSLRATQVAPESIEAWLLRATLASSLEERLICVNRLNELAPGYRDRYNVAFFALKELLDKNPYLAYLEETDDLYRVASTDHVLSIPKKRAPVDPYPPEKPASGSLASAYRWLNMAIMGLLVAGIGAVIFAPLAALAAIRAQQSVQSPSEQVSSMVVLIAAFGLFLLGFFFSLLFVLHWLG
jgi:hypothetical protein